MLGDSSNRRNFLKAMGLTAAAMVVPVSLGASVSNAAPATGSSLGALELWLLDTGAASLDTGLHGSLRKDLTAAIAARGESLP